ncbi:MAG: HAMP domain-containing protein [Methylocystaceae bacterium]|nr:HAMP domain-containing protein [Methylocystaceae bacterium]
MTREERLLVFYKNILDIRDGKIAVPQHYNNLYWDQVLAGLLPPPDGRKEGASSLEERLIRAGITTFELEKVHESKRNSDKLSRLELVAMHAANGELDDGTDSFTIKGKPDQKMAIRLLNDAAYLEAKGQVVKPIAEFIELVETKTKEKVDAFSNQATDLVRLNAIIAIVIVGLISLAVLIIVFKLGIRSAELLKVVRKISNKDFSAKAYLAGNDEIAELAASINLMSDELGKAFTELNEKVDIAEKMSLELEEERSRSEKLLYNILPAVIAERLRSGEKTIAETFQEVTVAFADIVDFTTISSRLGPFDTVHMLNEIFGILDRLVEKHEIEKIKTIGDCYMVVGGVPKRNPLHCQNIAQFAIDAISAIKEYSDRMPFDIRIRIGIHTGTVAAGVIGQSRFSYDLWGEVVNLASRLEGTSKDNLIHVSDTVKSRLSDDFIFIDGGMIELKGFDPMHSWFLIGNKNHAASVIEIISQIDPPKEPHESDVKNLTENDFNL